MTSSLTWFELAEFDDYLTTSIVDRLFYWAQVRKACSQPENTLGTDDILRLIRKYLIFPREDRQIKALTPSGLLSKQMNFLLKEFMALDSVKLFLSKYQEEYKVREFIKHSKRYFQIYSKDCGFDICTTDRYFQKTQKVESCVIAKKRFEKNEQIKYLYGSLATLNEEEVNNLDQNDFSIINISSKNHPCLMLGPTRFVNHDCNGNAKFSTNRNGISIIATRKILPGEEITVPYASSYFGKDNRDCLCATCEKNSSGAYTISHPNVKVVDFTASDLDDNGAGDSNGKADKTFDISIQQMDQHKAFDEQNLEIISDLTLTPKASSESSNSDKVSVTSSSTNDVVTATSSTYRNEYHEVEELKSDKQGKNEAQVSEEDEEDDDNAVTYMGEDDIIVIDSISDDDSDILEEFDAEEHEAFFRNSKRFYPSPESDSDRLYEAISAEDSIDEIEDEEKIEQLELQRAKRAFSKKVALESTPESLVEETNSTEVLSAKKDTKFGDSRMQMSGAEKLESATAKRVLRPRMKAKILKQASTQVTLLDSIALDNSVDTIKESLKSKNQYNSSNKKLNFIEFSQRKICRTLHKLYNRNLYDPNYQAEHEIYDCQNCGCYFEFESQKFAEMNYRIEPCKFAPRNMVKKFPIDKLYCWRCLRHYKVFKLAWPFTRYEINENSEIEMLRQFLVFWPTERKPICEFKNLNDENENESEIHSKVALKDELAKKNLGNVNEVFHDIDDLKIKFRTQQNVFNQNASLPLRLYGFPSSLLHELCREWVAKYRVYEKSVQKPLGNNRETLTLTKLINSKHKSWVNEHGSGESDDDKYTSDSSLELGGAKRKRKTNVKLELKAPKKTKPKPKVIGTKKASVKLENSDVEVLGESISSLKSIYDIYKLSVQTEASERTDESFEKLGFNQLNAHELKGSTREFEYYEID